MAQEIPALVPLNGQIVETTFSCSDKTGLLPNEIEGGNFGDLADSIPALPEDIVMGEASGHEATEPRSDQMTETFVAMPVAAAHEDDASVPSATPASKIVPNHQDSLVNPWTSAPTTTDQEWGSDPAPAPLLNAVVVDQDAYKIPPIIERVDTPLINQNSPEDGPGANDTASALARQEKMKLRYILKMASDPSIKESNQPADGDGYGDGIFVSDDPVALSLDVSHSNHKHDRARSKGRKRKRPYSGHGSESYGASQGKRSKVKKSDSTSKQRRKLVPPTVTNLGSICGTNVFDDAEKIVNLPSQPTFAHNSRRIEQFKEIVAALPDADKAAGRADRDALNRAIKCFDGQGSVKGHDGNWLVAGMKTPLKPHQVLAAGFMRRREKGQDEPRGGILADQMGLGKTIEMLANIVNGKLSEIGPRQPTLIVAPSMLVTQWREEIAKHVWTDVECNKYGLGMVVEHRAGRRSDLEVLSRANIILTTYSEVARSYPKAIIPVHLAREDEKNAWWESHYEQHKGSLHKLKYLRVVLDEAHAIKNEQAHTSKACRALHAAHYWAMTGTPIMNTVKEFYPYFKLLKVPNTESFKSFTDFLCSPDDPDGIERLSAALHELMVRRTHADTIFNSRLLDLPTPKERIMWLEFNEVEREIYEIVKKRIIARINTLSKTEGLQKNYHNVWTMLLRLRQLCSHVFTIQETFADLLEREDFEKLNALSKSEEYLNEQSRKTLAHLRHVLSKHEDDETDHSGVVDAATSIDIDVADGGVDVDACGDAQEDCHGGRHGLTYRFTRYLDDLRASDKLKEIDERSRCPSCNHQPYEPKITSCHHIYCKQCLEDHQRLAAQRGYDGMRCLKCGDQFTEVSNVVSYETLRASSLAGVLSQRATAGKKIAVRKMENWIDMNGEVLSSAKTRACKAQLIEWLKTDPTQRIIVFTQFLNIIKILDKVCQTEGWKRVQLHGKMTLRCRQRAIQDFGNEQKGIQIMLASLKCGGLGLNLTMASRVICFDPWWNEAIEQQAFCRVYRIGQNRTSELTRFAMKNTIESAMMALKDRKQADINDIMNSAKTKLHVNDLLGLLGPVDKDTDGRPLISV